MIADLTGQVAFVTGAGSGIGRAMVHCLVEQGAVCTDVANITGQCLHVDGRTVIRD